jgi:hypothetical protein
MNVIFFCNALLGAQSQWQYLHAEHKRGHQIGRTIMSVGSSSPARPAEAVEGSAIRPFHFKASEEHSAI